MSEPTSEADKSQAEEPSEQAMRAVLRARTSEIEALQQGAALMAQSLGPGLLVLLVYAVGGAIGGSMAADWGLLLVDHPPEADSGFPSLMGGIAIFLAIYGGIQLSKSDTATRASWWPVMLLTPALALLGAHSAVGSQLPPQIVPVLALFGWDLVWESFVGSAVVFAWISLANGALDGTTARLDEILRDLRSRYLDVVVVHGTKAHAVTIGSQLILPGIFYALSFAFSDQIVTAAPERKALRRSSQLTYGMRGRLFRLLAGVFFVTLALSIGVWSLVDGMPDGIYGRLTQFVMSPASASGPAMFGQRVVGGLALWITSLAMIVLYREREAQVAAKRALTKMKAKSA